MSPIAITPRADCHVCKGSGTQPCRSCEGRGGRPKLFGLLQSPCPVCSGRGHVTCSACESRAIEDEALDFATRNLPLGLWEKIMTLPEVPHPKTITMETGDREHLIALLERLQPTPASAMPLGDEGIGWSWELSVDYEGHARHELDVQRGVSGMYYWRLHSW